MSGEELAAMDKQIAACKADCDAERAMFIALVHFNNPDHPEVRALRLAYEKAHAAHVIALKALDTIQDKGN